MTVQSWYNFSFAVASFLTGLIGIIFHWPGLALEIFFLVLGALGMAVIGWPIWRRFWQALVRGAQACDDQNNGKHIGGE